MPKEMLINVSEGEECRIALLEDGKLEELYMERTSSTSHVGNIYKGRVTNVEPSIQAAFVDFGLGRNGFLHISDLMPTYFGRRGEDVQESVGRKMARRDRPPIQRCLRRGDDLIVQIIKEGIGTKGPTLSTYLSIPGRILVMMPGMSKLGVSRKIEDEDERRRLRKILDELKPPKECGFIIRTAGVGKSKTDIERDLKYLTRLWENIDKKQKSGPGPMELYTEGDLVTRTVRDVFSTDLDRLVVDSPDVARRIKEFVKISAPRTKNKVELYEEPIPLFHKYGIEREIEQMYSRHVPLPSGGSLVIDSTEAIVAIDVNSGKFRDHSDAETTAFKTDMEAADEIPRQLKLRDLGGVIICDFIDLRYERHRRELETRLHENFKRDRAKTKVLRMSQFGIIELTRQRMRPSLKRSIYFDCPHCKGAGLVKTPESMSLDVMRRLAIALNDARPVRAELGVCPEVSFYLQNRKRTQLATLEQRTAKRLVIRADPTLGLDEMRLDLFDGRDGLVILEELGMTQAALPHTTQLGTRPHGQQARGGRGDRRDQGRGRDRGDRGGDRGAERGRDHRRDREGRGDREEMESARAGDGFGGEDVEDAVEGREEERRREDERARERSDRGRGQQPQGRGRDRGPRQDQRQEPRDQRDQREEGGGIRGAAEESEFDTDAGSEAAPEAVGGGRIESRGGQPAEQRRDSGNGESEQGGGRRRRRRRRGRRGRGRGGEGHEGTPSGGQREEAAAPHEDESDRFDEAEDREDHEDRDAVEGTAPAEESEGLFPAPEPIEDVDEERAESDEARREEEAGTEQVSAAESFAEPEAEAKPAPEPEPEKPKRSRRTRGKSKKAAAEQAEASEAAPAEAAEAVQGKAEKASTPRRRSRGGRTRKRTGDAAEGAEPAPGGSAVESASEPAAPAAPVVIPQPPITRTGSTDRHLVSDEPVAPQPLSRPRSYRDLDAIPDDFD